MNAEELWDWCGCDFRHQWEYKIATCKLCEQVRDTEHDQDCYPALTLANLYNFAIPRLQGAGYVVTLISYEHTEHECRIESVIDKNISHSSGVMDNPADAIVRAIEKTT